MLRSGGSAWLLAFLGLTDGKPKRGVCDIRGIVAPEGGIAAAEVSAGGGI
jgi:hypothetical protein